MEKRRKSTMSVREMGELLGLKKVESYWLVHKEYFETILVNGKMRIVIESFEEWYAGQVKYHKVNGPPPGERLRAESYSARELGELLGISEAYAYEVIKQYQIPTITVDYWRRVRKEDFEKWYAGQDRFLTKKDRQILDAAYGESMSLPDMARMLDVPRSTVYYILNGEKGKKYLREIMVGGKRHVTRESFEAWYASQTKYLKPADEPEGYVRKTLRYQDTLTAKAVIAERNKKPINTSANPNLLTIAQAAELAGVDKKRIYKWMKEGYFGSRKFSGSLVRIDRKEFEDFLKSGQAIVRRKKPNGSNHKKK